jgi:hypothetical protein
MKFPSEFVSSTDFIAHGSTEEVTGPFLYQFLNSPSVNYNKGESAMLNLSKLTSLLKPKTILSIHYRYIDNI